MLKKGCCMQQNPLSAWKGQLHAMQSALHSGFFFFPGITYSSDTENLVQNVLQTNPRGCMYTKIALYILFTSLAEDWYNTNYYLRDSGSVFALGTCSFQLCSSAILKKTRPINKEPQKVLSRKKHYSILLPLAQAGRVYKLSPLGDRLSVH